MKKNYIKHFKLGLKSQILGVIAGLFAFSVNAQTITFDSIPPGGSYFIGAPALLEFDSTVGGGQFPSEAIFYLHRGTLQDNPENIFGQTGNVGTLNFSWKDLGNITDLRLSAATGDVERTFNDLGGNDATILGGSFNGFTYSMSGLGRRRLLTPSIDLSGSQTTVLELSVNRANIDPARPLRVYISVNQGGFTILQNTDGNQSFSSDDANPNSNLEFELLDTQKTSDVRFRIDQGGDADNNYGAGVESWFLDHTSSRIVQGDELNVINTQFLGNNYFVSEPSTGTPIVNITSDITDSPTSSLVTDFNTNIVRQGDTIQVISIFNADASQLNNYDYTAVFERNNSEFLLDMLDSRVVAVDGASDSIIITGIVPFNIDEINETWTLEVRALESGATPIAGRLFNGVLDDDEQFTGVGGTVNTSSNTWTFNEDGERSLTSLGITVSSADSTSITFTLAKASSAFVPAGSEIIVEYMAEGQTTFTAIAGAEFNLNDDLTDDVMVDGLPSGAVSPSTVFRISQKGVNGAGLSGWTVSSFTVRTGSTFIDEAADEIEYFGRSINVSTPSISLDPAGLPDAGAFPGSVLDFSYDVTSGVIPSGTEFELVTLIGGEDFILTTFTSTADQNGSDFNFTSAMPAFEGGNFDVFLRAREATSNTVTIPFNELGITIDTVTVATARDDVLEAGVEIIFPGDEIEVQFTIDGTIESMAELMLEVRDYDQATSDNDGYVTLTSLAGPVSNSGSINGVLPSNINYNGGGSPMIRLRVGSGLLIENDFITGLRSSTGVTNGSINLFNENYFPNDLKVGITSFEDFSGPGERSVTSHPIAMPRGGEIDITLNGGSFASFTQVVSLQGSVDDGATWITIEESEFTPTSYAEFDDVEIPVALWGDATRIRIIYNEDGAADQGENVIDFGFGDIRGVSSVTGNREMRSINDQLRFPSVSLESLESDDFLVGESLFIEYNATNFPNGTEFGIVLNGNDTSAVIGQGGAIGLGSIEVTLPAFAFEDNGSGAALYNEIEIVAYDPGTNGGLILDNEVNINMDDQFLVIEGTDEEDGNYTFDQTGNRSLLTQAYDLTASDTAVINFTFNPRDISATDNKLTIPVLQVSIDGGTSFQNISVDDEDQIAVGALFVNNNYSVGIPAQFRTAATHFRWWQELNLGQGSDRWSVSNISVELSSGNELDIFYQQISAPRVASVSHPDSDDYRFEQADNDVAVFNGDSFDYTWENRIDMVNQYPAGTSLQFILYNNNDGEFVIDPDTDRPFIIGTATGTGTFTANVPFFVTNGNYGVRLIASNGDYFYEGDEDGESTTTVGNLDIFLRAIRTSLVGDENDVIYAGSTVTFSTGIENDDANSINANDLFANLIVNYNGDDWILATQQGTADISADLPPFINGNRNFRIELSEDAPLGEVGDVIGNSELESLGSDADNFIAGTIDESIETPFAEFINSDDRYRVQFDYSAPSNVSFSLQRSINGGDYVTQNNYFGSSGTEVQSSTVFLSFAQNIRYRWILTSGESLEISNVRIEDDENNQENFFGTNLTPNNFADRSLNFENNTGRGLITTRDFEVGELENASLVSFDLNFDEIPANMVANQFLVFEFSTDGGANYTELDTFPEADAEEPLDGESFAFAITDAMKTNPTRFRFRQEERNNIAISIPNFTFVAGQSLPFDYISTNENILTQAILINSISVSETCIENSFDINYEIRGRFGTENVLEIQYENRTNNNGVFNLDGFEFDGITQGTGTLTAIQLPGDVLPEGGSNGNFYFRINADDDTNEDFNFSVTGTFNEEGVEVVAPVNLDASFNLPSQRLCDLQNLEVSINSPQSYFTYELRNAADGTVLGTLTYDPEDGNNIIEIGELTDEIVVELAVTAKSSAGLECATIVSTFNDELTVLNNFQLFRRNANDNRILVEAGDGESNCEGQANVIRLEVARRFDDGSFSIASSSNVEWFRDDINNPIANPGTVLGDNVNELIRSGNYFARVTDGDCVYTTESFTVTIIDTPDKPTVTVTSGELSGCEGAEDVVLTAPDGFAFYQWSSGETTQSITVEDAGRYSVSVSNESFVNSCGSEFSEPIIVEREELPFFEVSTSTTLNNGKIAAGETIDGCEGRTVYFFSDQIRTVNGGTVSVTRDGAVVASTTSSSFFIEESGTYSFTWSNNNINFDCEASTVEFTVNIIERPEDVPVLTSTGNLEFCDREGEVTLTAPAGFAQYRWYRNGTAQTSNIDGFDATSNTLVVRQDGDYAVEVGNSASCFSPRSNVIELTVRGLPNIPGFSQFEATCGEGPITFSFSGNNLYSYQLINAFTGQPSGDPVIGNDGTTFISSASVAEFTDFYLEVSYADGSGCANSIATNEVTGSPNNVVLEADGNRLVANISRWGGTPQREIRWFRNGVLLRNRTNDGSITVTDAAEYSVEVEFEGEGLCVVTSNSIDLGGGVVPPTGSTGGRIEANSYPNPSQGGVVNVDIKGDNFGKYQINIMTLTGQVLVSADAEKDAVDYSEQIDISNLERGIYNIQVIKGKEFKNIRFIIQ